jgi:hypothetical protein
MILASAGPIGAPKTKLFYMPDEAVDFPMPGVGIQS